MITLLPSFLLLSLLSLSLTQEFEGKPSALIQLDDAKFISHIRPSEFGDTFVMFYAAWCGACKNTIGNWAKYADSAWGKVVVGAIDV
jgi:hypothetical protein